LQTLTAKGQNGTVTFDGNFITIDRKGGLARLTVGKGEKRIPITSVTAVQWKPPGGLVNGFIQFTLGGGNERRSTFGRQTMDAVNDENSVIVTKKQIDEFLVLRTAVEDAIVTRGQPQVLLAPASAPASKLEQLKQLGELRDSGVLSADEFETEKAAIMGGAVEHAASVEPALTADVAPSFDNVEQDDAHDSSSEDSERRKGGRMAGRIAGAVATGGLSEAGRFAMKKRNKV
jgi:hypothetical protein